MEKRYRHDPFVDMEFEGRDEDVEDVDFYVWEGKKVASHEQLFNNFFRRVALASCEDPQKIEVYHRDGSVTEIFVKRRLLAPHILSKVFEKAREGEIKNDNV
ncbi:hypothetical protein LLE49_19825 [Alicyclobacillus tolerans]|uniref:hypothetical protein n=1 Tax=Alicyclobacillus tolerans TaxID=90970 RepID=UPI001F192EA0|nr:hypothetical protein [Alicyclobacillus tolerans]MCF8566973.1 hypothetical protein [Alicyclobacillus tolerans]